MDSLCDAVESELTKVFGLDAIDNWEIEDGEGSCRVRTPEFLITFDVDPRDQLITSNIVFLRTAEADREPLYLHIISRILPDLSWDDRSSSTSRADRLSLEIGRIYRLLKLVNDGAVSPRDLRYFYLGYNCAYTDYT